ncbi:PH domain-containing protein DDB_G0287875-like isoform X2 [Gadus chalcogrammus]|uniref:PH domain-containing protein DDB_G0287875-like isoform X2 n=1 Tax=Gadus chalcogrammus TaxID=1042646 RepID=UPI0024C4BEB9|nr:PH domain-containing protein DDB_G0287875-like isoform X2 [Gadus chalcogrammus]
MRTRSLSCGGVLPTIRPSAEGEPQTRLDTKERRLLGKVTAPFLKRKWENLKQKYKDLKNTPTSVSTEGGETTAASWKWFDLMHEAIGDRPSVTPPVLIATCAQGAVVFTAPSISTPERDMKVEAAEETALGSPTPTTTGTSTASTPKRRRMYVVEVLQELKSQDEQDWRALQAEEREREKRREAEQARQAAEREQREERRYRELCERQERCHQEAVAREERWREEMRARDERRDQEASAREDRFLAILERLAPK